MISPRCMEKVQGGVVGFPAVKYLMQLQTPTHPLIPSPVGFTYRGPVLCLCANTGRALNSVVHGFVADPRWLSPTPRDHGHTYLSPSGYPPSWVEFERFVPQRLWRWHLVLSHQRGVGDDYRRKPCRVRADSTRCCSGWTRPGGRAAFRSAPTTFSSSPALGSCCAAAVLGPGPARF